MASLWLSVLAAVWININALIKGVDACAKVQTPALVVPVGSSISASCVIEHDCLLTKDKDFRVEWLLNNHLVPNNQESNGTYSVLIPNFTDSSADIVCSICSGNNCQKVDGVKVKVGYPPPVPQNLSCALNLTGLCRLLCKWDPGQEITNIPTNYSLHTEIRYHSDTFNYRLPPGVHYYWITRSRISLFSEMEFYVTAVNALGKSTSAPLVLKPMESAKFDPPEIQRIEAHMFECLDYRWHLSEAQNWVDNSLNVELILKTLNTQIQDKELVFSSKQRKDKKIKVCGLRHGTDYSTKMRVRYSSGPWSEWSESKVATTRMKAPTGRLDTWLKIQDDGHTAYLYWKPSQQFRANGWNVSYIVESKEPEKILCVTSESHCSFKLSKRVRKVYLRAINPVGSSNLTEVAVWMYRKTGLAPVSNFSVHPQTESSLLIEWESPMSSNIREYVLEWRPLSQTPATLLSFALTDKNHSSSVLAGFKPYTPYNISIYPKYVYGVGQPLTVIAYSSQKAPSVVPELKVAEIRHSHVEFFWDEIPIEQRNGIIQGYTLFFWKEKDNIRVIKTTKTDVVVRDLQPLSTYKALLMVHTMGGSLNGSVETLKSGQFDAAEIVLFVIPACTGLSLLIIITVFTCFGKHERLKMCLWPKIPDPANSSIRRWTTTESLQNMPPLKEDKDPVLVYLSHFSLLDLSEKEQFKRENYVKNIKWSHDHSSHDEGHDVFCHNSSQNSSSYCTDQDRDSVPYATVVFAGPYRSHPVPPPVYLRSESTQPLLAGDDLASPPPYENASQEGSVSEENHFTVFHTDPTEDGENKALWEKFPMLRSLDIRDSDSDI